MSAIEPISNRARTKIVATVGPACSDPEVLRELVGAGVDVFRVNMAHGSRDEHQRMLEEIRAAASAGFRPIGILVDLAGPKIRLGTLATGSIECNVDDEFRFVRNSPNGPTDLTCSYPLLIDELRTSDRVLLADGNVEMVVTDKQTDFVTCRVVGPGTISSRQGINLPGVELSVPSMSDVDRDNAIWAAENGVDFVSLSFVRAADDILQLKKLLKAAGSSAMAISKIEKPEAIENLEAIVSASDGVMVARGDLGVEIDVAEMPVRQKDIIRCCQRWKKPVIVATQMLDSMQRANRPTRAEVTDVANAILDGADACMLSGETAIGKFPIGSVQMMNRIMISTEHSLESDERRGTPYLATPDCQDDSVHPITSALVSGAGLIARRLNAKIVVIATRSGRTALAKAKRRDFIPTIAVSDYETTLRQMCLFWGINPVAGVPQDMDHELIPFIVRWGRENGLLTTKDRIVLVAGTQVRAEAHNQLVVHEIE